MKKWFSADFNLIGTENKPDENQKTEERNSSRKRRSQSPSKRNNFKKRNIVSSNIKNNEISSTSKENGIDWLDKFKPTKTEELAINPKKLQELRFWFEIYVREKNENPCRILTIEGPAGSAKTISTKLLAKELNYEIVEWINSVDIDADADYEDFKNFGSYENQVEKFMDYLMRSSRYGSIFGRKNRLLLVKDFPNIFMKKTEEFWKALRQYKTSGRSPLIFVLTETSSRSLNIAYNLFPDDIRRELHIETIQFNSIAQTMMKKALARICTLITDNPNNKKFINSSVDITNLVDPIIDQAQGDIRSAVLNLHFAAQNGTLDVKLTNHKTKRKTTKKNAKTKDTEGVSTTHEDSSGMGRNETLTTMHGLGRVMYPKYELNIETKIEMLTHRPESIVNHFITQKQTFMGLIHSNYIKNFDQIDQVAEMTEIFSMSDLLASEYRDLSLHDVNLDMIVRGAMVLNRNRKPGFRKITGFADKQFKQLELGNQKAFIDAKHLNNGNLLSPNVFHCDYRAFIKLIDSRNN